MIVRVPKLGEQHVMLNLDVISDDNEERTSELIALALLTGKAIPYKIINVWEPLYQRGDLFLEPTEDSDPETNDQL